MLVDKAKQAGLTTLFNLMDEIFPMVTTSLTKNEILQMIPTLLGYSLGETTGFPSNWKFADLSSGSVVVPVTLFDNVVELHKFLYGDSVAYTPSSAVSSYSGRIDEIIANGGEGVSITEIPEEPEQSWTESSSDTSYDTGYDTDNSYSNDYNDYDNDYSNDYSDGSDGDYSGDYDSSSGYDDGGSDYSDGGYSDGEDGNYDAEYYNTGTEEYSE